MQGGANLNRVRTIYKIENTENGKVYIGMTVNLKQRKYSHLSTLRNQKHVNSRLQKDFNVYGEKNFKFSTLKKVKGWHDSLEVERHYIDKMRTEEVGYNMISNKLKEGKRKAAINVSIEEVYKEALLLSFNGDRKMLRDWVVEAILEKAEKENMIKRSDDLNGY